MIINQRLVYFDCAELHFYEPELVTTDILQYGYATERSGDILDLAIGINYFIQNTLTEEPDKLVAFAHSLFKIETNGSISLEEIHAMIEKTTDLLKDHINTVAQTEDKPLIDFCTPPLEDLQEGLQGIVDLFPAAGNQRTV